MIDQATRASYGRDRYTAGEADIVVSTAAGGPPLLFCHGSGDTAATSWAKTQQRQLVQELAQTHTVCVADLGYQTWGNTIGRTRVGQALDYLATLGASGPAVLVTGSMGTLNALGYALLHPERVRAVAAVIPALDLADLRVRGAAADMDTAYPGGYSETRDGPAYSPNRFVGGLDPRLPIHLFTAPDDTLTVPSTADTFVSARPQTMRTMLPPGGHSDVTVGNAIPHVRAWLESLK